MRAVPPPPEAEQPSLRGIVEGLQYARRRPELLGTYFVDMAAMFFGIPEALFPAFADELGGGPGALGLLYAAPAAGALVASATSGWVGAVHRHGLAVILAASVWGIAVIGFGLATSLVLALVLLALAGFADMVSGIFRTTIWNADDPRPPARTPGRHRDGQLHQRPPARQRRVGRRGLLRGHPRLRAYRAACSA